MFEFLLMKLAGTLAGNALPSTTQVVHHVKKAAASGNPKDLLPRPNYTLLVLAGVALAASFYLAKQRNPRA